MLLAPSSVDFCSAPHTTAPWGWQSVTVCLSFAGLPDRELLIEWTPCQLTSCEERYVSLLLTVSRAGSVGTALTTPELEGCQELELAGAGGHCWRSLRGVAGLCPVPKPLVDPLFILQLP